MKNNNYQYLWKNHAEQAKAFGLKYKEDEKLPENPDVFISKYFFNIYEYIQKL